MARGQELRTSKGLWVKPKAQLLLCSALSLGFVAMAVLVAVILFSFEGYLSRMRVANQIDMETSILISSWVFFYMRIVFTLAVFFAVCGVVTGIFLSHRVYGPMVPIRAHIARLINGDYSSRVHTRSGDEFKELAADLNSLAETLSRSPRK